MQKVTRLSTAEFAKQQTFSRKQPSLSDHLEAAKKAEETLIMKIEGWRREARALKDGRSAKTDLVVLWALADLIGYRRLIVINNKVEPTKAVPQKKNFVEESTPKKTAKVWPKRAAWRRPSGVIDLDD